MPRNACSTLATLTLSISLALPVLAVAHPGGAQQPAIPSPESVFGFRVGADSQLFGYDQSSLAGETTGPRRVFGDDRGHTVGAGPRGGIAGIIQQEKKARRRVGRRGGDTSRRRALAPDADDIARERGDDECRRDRESLP